MPGKYKNKNVLIIEDEDMLRRILKDFLQVSGYTADIVSSAEDAIKNMQETQYGLIISDIHLAEGMDGIEFFEKLQENQPQVPVILMTGYNIDKIRDLLKDKNVAGFLPKPFKPSDLLPFLRQHLDIKDKSPEN